MSKTNSKHTPGPWHLNTLETVPYTIHAHRGCVAEVSRGTMNEVSADEIEANARLIAAAPELLEALIKIYNESGEKMTQFEYRQFINKTCFIAIAKAGGKS